MLGILLCYTLYSSIRLSFIEFFVQYQVILQNFILFPQVSGWLPLYHTLSSSIKLSSIILYSFLQHQVNCHFFLQLKVDLYYIIVVLGWIISLSVEPGIFRFQSKVLATPLSSLRSSSTFLLLSLTLLFFFSLSLCASSFVPLPPSFLLLLLAEKKWRQKKNESVFIHVTLPIIHFLSL